MLLSLIASLAVLFALTTASAFLAYGRKTRFLRITELGYLYAPVAMISIVLGLGQTLFQTLSVLGLGVTTVKSIQAVLFAGGGLWSLYLAYKMPGRWGLHMLPSAAGIGLVAWAWHRVLF